MVDETGQAASGVTVIVVNYRTPDLAIACIDALRPERALVPGLRAILVEGGSGDGSAERLAAAVAGDGEWLHFMPLPINGGYAWANNQAILHAMQGQHAPAFVHLLNPDAAIEPGAVARLIEHLQRMPGCGAVGSQLIDPGGPYQVSAFRFPRLGSELARGAETPGLLKLTGTPDPVMAHSDVAIETDWVPGASVMIRTAALRETGLFDDGFFLYFEEVELMWRIRRAGWSIWLEPASRVRHVAGAATGVQADGSALAAKPRPDYWYRAQRRVMVRILGPARARLSLAIWMAGRALGAVRERLQPARAMHRPPGEVAAVKRAWARPMAIDATSAAVDWRTPPGAAPAWMREQ